MRENNSNDMRASNFTAGLSSTYTDLQFNSNDKMIVERNDRFIIFKMVPQANISQVRQTISQSQATPLSFNDRIHGIQQLKKTYHETVEDDRIQSDEEQKY